ncbi:MAG: lipid-A-disaccharide synthase [Fusobacteriota bacterium]
MKYFVSTGEVSGDLHLSYLVKEMKKLDENVRFYGVAGEHSKKAGVEIIQNIDDLAIMGFIEALSKYKFLKNKAKEYIKFINSENIDKVILIDYGGFNLYFLKLLKKTFPNIKVYYYIPPKLWVWGKRRIKKLKLADEILVIFPWEVDFYKKYNLNTVYYGNPLVDKLKANNKKNEISKILLLPGSRRKEISKLLPSMVKIMYKLKNKKFILKLASTKHLDWIKEDYEEILEYKNLKIILDGDLQKSTKDVQIAIAASGTVTLELALLGIPTIVGYKVNKINEWIARFIIDLDFFSLPNITLKREIFPELLQDDFNPKRIINEIENINRNYDSIKKDLLKIREILGGEEIIKKYAKFLMNN